MKAFEIQEFGIDKLRLVERENDRVRGSVRCWCRMTAASLNYRDLHGRRGRVQSEAASAPWFRFRMALALWKRLGRA